MFMIFIEIHTLLLATNSLLIEKGIFTKEELEKKRSQLFSLMREYFILMASKDEGKEKEAEKLSELLKISKDIMKEANFDLDQLQDEYIKKQFEDRLIPPTPPVKE